MRNHLLIAAILANVCLALSAQSPLSRRQIAKQPTYNEIVVNKYIDTLQTIIAADTLTPVESVLNNPYVYPLLLNPTFYHFPVRETMYTDWKPRRIHSDNELALKTEPALEDSIAPDITRNLMWVYTQTPWLATMTESDIAKAEGIRSDLEAAPDKEVIRIAPAEKNIDLGLDDATVKVITRRPNFWKFGGSYSLQFMQNYISANWYQGGESNNSFLATASMYANFNNKKKLTFENNVDMRLGFRENRSDKVHKYHTNDDRLRLVNKLGLKAFKNWYYTFLLQTTTQFYPNYGSNSNTVYSDFLSPVNSNFSIGMEYKLSVKNFSLSANIGALSYDFKYVDRDALRTRFGIRLPHHSDTDFGSNITIRYSWRLFKNIVNEGRIYYYTNYERILYEHENTTTFTFNKYLSTKFYVFPRFDDTHYRNGKAEFFQFRQQWSFGLNMSF